MVFVNKTYDMIINTQFYTKYRPRVLRKASYERASQTRRRRRHRKLSQAPT